MKKHTKIYLKEMGYSIADFIPCEVCGVQSVDIHHLIPRGAGGSKEKDYIENLMALCRPCHLKAEARTLKREDLQEIHNKNYANRTL